MRVDIPLWLWGAQAPSVFGKLPVLGDFYRRGMSAGLAEQWMQRIEQWRFQELGEVDLADSATVNSVVPELFKHEQHELPWCFVWPAHSHNLSGRHVWIGVMQASRDSVGRNYPVVMAQCVSYRWAQNELNQAKGWLFWASRIMQAAIEASALETPDAKKPVDLYEQLAQCWKKFAPSWRHPIRIWNSKSEPLASQYISYHGLNLDAPPDDDSHLGVAHLPWPDVLKLAGASGRAVFWQQNAWGRYTRVCDDQQLLQPLLNVKAQVPHA